MTWKSKLHIYKQVKVYPYIAISKNLDNISKGKKKNPDMFVQEKKNPDMFKSTTVCVWSTDWHNQWWPRKVNDQWIITPAK